ncbi:MAG: pyrroline-5-carboxylate reductase [Magnetococcales bacterium]|nr:pyrroline-5-carboxylate reductase [Magnetococcales bacterium]
MLEDTTIAFLGGGNMASAILHGLIEAKVAPLQIRVSDPVEKQRNTIANQYRVIVFGKNRDAIVDADLVVVAVKPHLVTHVLKEIAEHLKPNAIVLSIAAGITLSAMRKQLDKKQPLVRVMPNTPALIGAGISALVGADGIEDDQLAQAEALLSAVGKTVRLSDEALMDGVTALSGSGPAYIFMMIEALSDGGVSCGLPRPLADQLALQTIIGSAQLAQESGLHPGELKNQVTSPGGTTIAGLTALERHGVRGALIDAVRAAWKRAKELA